MKTTALFFVTTATLLVAGCKTTETKPVTWEEQSAYMAQVKDPRRFGYSIYQTPSGIHYRGGCRLHPNQAAEIPMKAKEPLRPVGLLRGKSSEAQVLFDLSSPSSWLEFDVAQKFGAQPVGEQDAELIRLPDEEFAGCLSVVPSLRLGQLQIENPLVYVRFASGPLGVVARGIEKPDIRGVIGWDVLKNFEQIVFDYIGKRVVVSTVTADYRPNPALLVAKIPLVTKAEVCTVSGFVDGKASLIQLDPAGDFEVATDSAAAVSLVQLDAHLSFSTPVIARSPGGTRIGARLLKNYRITIAPQAGSLYMEHLSEEKP